MASDGIGKYVIVEKVARGAESVLYKATCGRHVYCVKSIRNFIGKLLGPASIRSHEEKLTVAYGAKVKHLTNEFAIGQKFQQLGDSPIVRMYGLRRIKPLFLEWGYDLIMEFIDGDDLGDKRALKMLTLHDKIDYFHQAATALRCVHRHGYLHLDMKPSNIMITKGQLKLIDFGVSCPVGVKPRSVAGTAGYLSPEQIVMDPVDEGTDVFALGVTFAVVFGGKPLHQEHDDLEDKVTRMEARYHLTSLEKPLITDVPEANGIEPLRELISQCTVTKRDKRIRDMDTVLMRLRGIMKDLDIKVGDSSA